METAPSPDKDQIKQLHREKNQAITAMEQAYEKIDHLEQRIETMKKFADSVLEPLFNNLQEQARKENRPLNYQQAMSMLFDPQNPPGENWHSTPKGALFYIAFGAGPIAVLRNANEPAGKRYVDNGWLMHSFIADPNQHSNPRGEIKVFKPPDGQNPKGLSKKTTVLELFAARYSS